MTLTADWIDFHRDPQMPPDRRYPTGIDIDLSNGGKSCAINLPYPAARCGAYHIECDVCGMTAMVTTAGRPDDPRSVKIKCRLT